MCFLVPVTESWPRVDGEKTGRIGGVVKFSGVSSKADELDLLFPLELPLRVSSFI